MMLKIWYYEFWQAVDSLSDSTEEKHVTEDDWQPLEKHSGWAGIVQVLHHQHVSVKVLSHLRQPELKPGKEWRVVQCPLGCILRKIEMLFKCRGNVKTEFEIYLTFFLTLYPIYYNICYIMLICYKNTFTRPSENEFLTKITKARQ